MKYYKGRGNLAATVFVPFKCGNDCKFCNTNSLYDGFVMTEEIIDHMIDSIHICNDSDFVSEFVITGGEPFMNLDILKRIVNEMDKTIFINTSLPMVDNINDCIDYMNSEDKIKGVNISRHIGTNHNVRTVSLEYINKIKKNVRINCIIKPDMLDDSLIDFVDMYATPYRMINFRADYRMINKDNLKSRDTISEWMLSHYKWETTNSCLVCNSEFYSDEKYTVVCYHRGIEHSSVTYGDRCYVNDIIIDMYGNIYKDWDMVGDKEFETILQNT